MKYIVTLCFLLCTKIGYTQVGREITYGFYVGGIYSSMSNLPDVIVRKGIYKNYNLNTEARFGFIGGVYLNWKHPLGKFGIQPEIFYSKQSTRLNYDDIKGLKYKMDFNYSYINTGLLFKYYPLSSFYITLGPCLGINITRDNITYSSNGSQLTQSTGVLFQPDPVVQKVLSESLKGSNYIVLGGGFEFNKKITIGARYNIGLADGLETQENGFLYSENNNIIKSISLHIGYIFEYDDSKNF
jgi:Outer membrane protein beta-barrel domain